MGKKVIQLQDGSGGPETTVLLKKLFKTVIGLKPRDIDYDVMGLDVMDDAAFIRINGKYLVITTDSYTVNPLFFPGGDLGRLSVTGTINDLAVSGADPIGILDAIIIEEGLPLDIVEKISSSFQREVLENDLILLGGDLKVMPKGQLDKMVITTTGIGFTDKPIIDNNLREGDKIIVSGSIGEHGSVIAALQYGVDFDKEKLKSDVAPVYKIMKSLRNRHPNAIHAARDPTRGGLSMVLNDWAETNNVKIIIEEKNVPISPQVKAISDVLGLDPFQLASEGRVVLGVSEDEAEEILWEIRGMGYDDANIIGNVSSGEPIVVLKTRIGGYRVMEPPTGLLLPRIC